MNQRIISDQAKPGLFRRLSGKLTPAPASTVLAARIQSSELLDPADLPWTAALERQSDVILREAAAVLFGVDRQPSSASGPTGTLSSPGSDGRWRSFFLWGYGYRLAMNCDRCPETAQLVQHIPDLISAFFSVLAPGAHIPQSRGATKDLITCHLGLMVPTERDACWMRVGEETLHWSAGKCILFDDSNVREIRNDTAELRVILLIQVKRPAPSFAVTLGELFRRAITGRPIVQKARHELGNWRPTAHLGDQD